MFSCSQSVRVTWASSCRPRDIRTMLLLPAMQKPYFYTYVYVYVHALMCMRRATHAHTHTHTYTHTQHTHNTHIHTHSTHTHNTHTHNTHSTHTYTHTYTHTRHTHTPWYWRTRKSELILCVMLCFNGPAGGGPNILFRQHSKPKPPVLNVPIDCELFSRI